MPTNLQQIAQNVAQKEVLINQNFQAVSPAGIFSRRNPLTTGLTFQYYGGTYPDSSGVLTTITDGSIACSASANNYIEFDQTQKIVVSNTNGFTASNLPICICSTNENNIISYTDYRIIPLIPYGSAGSGGGGGGSGNSNDVFELEGSNLSSVQDFDGKVKGGKIPKTSGTVSNNNYYTIEDTYVGIYPYSDTYVVFEIDQNGAKIAFYDSSDAYKKDSIRRLLYIIRKDPSDQSKTQIVDMRSLNLFINRKTIIRAVNYTSGAKSQTLDFSFLKGLQDTSYGFYGESMTNYPPIFSINVSFRCVSAEKGYAVGDETEFKTGNMLGAGLGCAYQYIWQTSNVVVSQGSMVYVWNKANQAYETATSGNWQIVVRIRLDI